MGFEIMDRRGEKKAAETAEPSVLEVVEDRLNRASMALANGNLAAANAVAAECKNPPATYGDVVEFKKTVRGEVQKWRSVGYVMVKMPTAPGQELMLLRAVGMRTDEGVFHADYALPPVWGEGEDYAAEAKKRLDTFLACSCDAGGPCKFHGEAIPRPGRAGKWLEEDIKRLQKIQSDPLPEAVEFLMRSEGARAQQRVVVPGR